MESAGSTPIVSVADHDLVALVQGAGPVATVYLTTEAEIENAAQMSERRWKDLRRALADAGAPEHVLVHIDALVPDAHLEGETLAVVAGTDGVRLVEHFPEPPLADRSRWAPLPWIVPVIEERQATITHVIITADRTGADIVLVTGEAEGAQIEAGGSPGPIHKPKAGGWSQRRYQQRAENTWEENAKDVAEQLAKLVERAKARLVVLAGDVRAVQLIQDALPPHVAALVEVAGAGDLDHATVRLVDTIGARDTVAALETFKEERGQHDRAADGASATIDTLNQSQVDVLLVHDDPDDERTAWFGADAIPMSSQAGDLKGLGVDSPVEGRLVDVLIRAALGTGAGVRIVPHAGGPKDQVGAILRWS